MPFIFPRAEAQWSQILSEFATKQLTKDHFLFHFYSEQYRLSEFWAEIWLHYDFTVSSPLSLAYFAEIWSCLELGVARPE